MSIVGKIPGVLNSYARSFVTALRFGFSRNNRNVRSVIALGSGNIIAFVLGTIGSLLAARFLGPAETGLYRFYTIPLTYLTFLHLGTFDGLSRQIPYFAGKGMQREVERLASAGGAWNLCLSVTLSTAFVLCSLYSLWRHDLFGTFGWLSQALFCWGVFYGGYLNTMCRMIHQFTLVARNQVVQMLSNFAIVFTLPVLQFYGLCARSAIPAVISTWMYHRDRPMQVSYRFDIKAIRDLVRIGLPFSFWGNLESSLWLATESALVLYFGGKAVLGLFVVAVALREGLSVLPLAVHQVLAPHFIESFARDGNLSKIKARTMLLSVGVTALMVIIVLIIAALLDSFVPLLIPKYVAGIGLMKLCLWFAVIVAANIPVVTLFATGRAWLYGAGVLVGFAVFLLCAYLLTPLLGAVIAVVAGSLLGRIARFVTAYVEIAYLK
jgi:O-antigen/teichoic acid export membrane protein